MVTWNDGANCMSNLGKLIFNRASKYCFSGPDGQIEVNSKLYIIVKPSQHMDISAKWQ